MQFLLLSIQKFWWGLWNNLVLTEKHKRVDWYYESFLSANAYRYLLPGSWLWTCERGLGAGEKGRHMAYNLHLPLASSNYCKYAAFTVSRSVTVCPFCLVPSLVLINGRLHSVRLPVLCHNSQPMSPLQNLSVRVDLCHSFHNVFLTMFTSFWTHRAPLSCQQC